MISIPALRCYAAVYPDTPPRTFALEQHIRIGTGFHNKWYGSQREHMLGWLVVQECQARMTGKNPSSVDARGMWGRLKCSPLMFWLAESAGVESSILDRAEAAAIAATRINPRDGNPHGTMMREVLPWDFIEAAISSGADPISPEQAEEISRAAFNRLTSKVATYRRHRDWLE